jgi:hypothetical protein
MNSRQAASAKSSKSSRRKGGAQRSDGRVVIAEFKLANSINRIFTKRIVAFGAIQTSGAGFLAASTLANSNGVNAIGDFSAVAGIYSNYRVKAIRCTVLPFFPVNTTAVVVPPTIAVVPFRSGLVPSTYQQFTESSEVRLCSGFKGYVFETSNKGYLDGRLWTPTSSSIASADSYGLLAMGATGVASTPTTYVWSLTSEYLVEFMTES